MVKMERRIISSVNPYVGARYPVHCSCCDSEVKPAITTESGYAVETISLVEAVDPVDTKPKATVTFMKMDIDNEVGRDSDKPQTMNMLSNTVENVSVDHAKEEDKTTTPMNITMKDAEVCNTDETKIKIIVTSPVEDTGTLNDPTTMAQDNCVEEQSSQSDEGFDASDADEVQTTCLVPPRVCRKIRLALDKARFCLQKINCTTTKRLQELSREQDGHVEALKKLASVNLTKHDSGIVDELCLISQELFKNMEHLKENMLDCQQTSLLDIIATLKQDVETEFSSIEQIDVQETKQESKQKLGSSNDSLMIFLRDAPWTVFGFASLVVANLGYFSQPWLLQSFHTCFVRYLDYFRNSTTFQ